MTTTISIHHDAMVDPRGEFRRKPAALAGRPTSLKGKSILLFDNSQLKQQLPGYGPIFRWLAEALEQAHGAHCSQASRNLLAESRAGLVQLAAEIAASGAHGVVVALCNAGITQPTSLFAAELESRGIPCVQMCTELGLPLAGITAAGYVPGLPIVLARLAAGKDGDQDSFGRQEALALVPDIVTGLTAPAEQLLDAFRKRFSSGELRIAEHGRMQLPDSTAEGDARQGSITITMPPGDAAVYEALCAAELSDGLPVIAPSLARVEAMLACTDLDPDLALVDELPPSGASITVRSLAANAVMAGCRPEYFPILVAAFQAMSDPAYRLFQGVITTHPAGNAIIVSGPLAEQLGIHSGAGCLGPGFRANATIGRAVNLTLMNVARAIPGKSDLGIFGSPAEFTYCFAESARNNPWPLIHAELFGPDVTTVTVHKCEGPHNVQDPKLGPEELLRTIAAKACAPGGNGLVHPAHLLVMLHPGQAAMIARAGWSKRDVKEFLFETARGPSELADKRGGAPSFRPYWRKLPEIPVVRSPDDVLVLVCGGGGESGGGFAMVGLPWGLGKAVTRAVLRKDGTPL